MSQLFQDVIMELSKLPSIGRRTAMRLTLHILKSDKSVAQTLAKSIDDFVTKIKFCKICNNLCDEDICPICQNRKRDHSTVCVVEEVSDLLSIENAQHYRGTYHVLGGVIAPMQGVGASDLTIDLLLDRVAGRTENEVKEVILALTTSVEGETTHYYLMNLLRKYENVKVTAIARGIGFGDELEYVDELTIAHALENRRDADE